jgi:hypothetical protein
MPKTAFSMENKLESGIVAVEMLYQFVEKLLIWKDSCGRCSSYNQEIIRAAYAKWQGALLIWI